MYCYAFLLGRIRVYCLSINIVLIEFVAAYEQYAGSVAVHVHQLTRLTVVLVRPKHFV
jgi:hypothetical protein